MSKKRISGLSRVVRAAIQALETRRLFAAGDLDPTFGTAGVLLATYGSSNDALDVAFQTDGKLVVAGDTDNGSNKDLFVARFNADGSADASFGTNGVTILSLPGDQIATSVRMMGDGRIVVAALDGDASSLEGDFLVGRLNANGSWDGSFAGGIGYKSIDLGGLDAVGDVYVDPVSNKITMAGATLSLAGGSIALVQLNADGSADPGFGTNGIVKASSGLFTGEGALAMTKAGENWLVSGFSVNVLDQSSKMLVAEFKADGSPVTTFGTNGKTTITFGDKIALGQDITVSDTGVIFVAGASADGLIDLPVGSPVGGLLGSGHATVGDFAIASLMPSGSPNAAFGSAGRMTTDFDGGLDGASGIAVQTDGKIVVSGGSEVATPGFDDGFGDSNFVTARYMPSGALDTTFATGGKKVDDLGGSDGAFQLRLDKDGKIVLVGHRKATDGNKLAVLRLLSSVAVTGAALSVGDASLADATAGGLVTFNVTLSAAANANVTVHFATADGTAVAGTDYVASAGDLTFTPGQTTKVITVSVNPSAVAGSRTFNLVLSDPSGATLDDATGTATLTVPAQPGLSVNDTTITDASEAGSVDFTVTLSQALGTPVTVHFATADGTAVAGTDYTTTSGDLTFAPGETSKTVSVPYAASGTPGTKMFDLVLSGADGAALDDATGTASLVTPAALGLSIGDASATAEAEGDLTFTVTLSAPSDQAVTVQYETADDTAIDGVDYEATAGELTFAPGETQQTITVHFLASATEGTKTFSVTLFDPTGAALSQSVGVGTLTTVLQPGLSVGSATVNNPGGAGDLSFTVSLSEASDTNVTVHYATVAGTAVAGTDFVATQGDLTFTPGQTSKTVTVHYLAPSAVGSKQFGLTLTNPVGASLDVGTGFGTIVTTAIPNVVAIQSSTTVGLPATIVGGTKTAKGVTTVILINNGNTKITGKTTVFVYGTAVSGDVNATTDLLLGKTTVGLNMPKHGSTQKVVVKLTVPAVAADRTIFLTTKATGAGIAEATPAVLTSPANSLTVQQARITLAGTGTAGPAITTKFGGKFSVQLLLKDLGNVDAAGSITVEFDITTDGTTDPASLKYFFFDKKLGFSAKVGATGKVKVSFTAPKASAAPGLVAGTQYILTARIKSSTLKPDNTSNGTILATYPITFTG